MIKPIVALICACSFPFLYSEEYDLSKPLITHEWFPPAEYSFCLGIDPAIPKDFVVRTHKPYADLFFMGREEVLKKFFQDTESLSEPILVGTLSMTVSAKNLLPKQVAQMATDLKKIDPNARVKSGFYGQYPYVEIKCAYTEQETAYSLLIGVNDPAESVVCFNLCCPKGILSKESIELWDTFVNKTTELPEPLLIKAQGFEMHPGYTIVNVGGLRGKVQAEQRKSDGAIQYTFIPLDPDISISFETPTRSNMATTWRHGESLLQIPGTIRSCGQSNIVATLVIPVLLIETGEFSSVPIMKSNVAVGVLPQEKKVKK